MTIGPETYRLIEKAVRESLTALPRGTQISTAQLVERLYQRDEERELAFRAVKALSYGALADCWTLGPVAQRYGKDVRPKQWHRPEPRVCKHCGGEL